MRIYSDMADQLKFWRIISFWNCGTVGIYSEWHDRKSAMDAFEQVDATENCAYMLVCFEPRYEDRKNFEVKG